MIEHMLVFVAGCIWKYVASRKTLVRVFEPHRETTASVDTNKIILFSLYSLWWYRNIPLCFKVRNLRELGYHGYPQPHYKRTSQAYYHAKHLKSSYFRLKFIFATKASEEPDLTGVGKFIEVYWHILDFNAA